MEVLWWNLRGQVAFDSTWALWLDTFGTPDSRNLKSPVSSSGLMFSNSHLLPSTALRLRLAKMHLRKFWRNPQGGLGSLIQCSQLPRWLQASQTKEGQSHSPMPQLKRKQNHVHVQKMVDKDQNINKQREQKTSISLSSTWHWFHSHQWHQCCPMLSWLHPPHTRLWVVWSQGLNGCGTNATLESTNGNRSPNGMTSDLNFERCGNLHKTDKKYINIDLDVFFLPLLLHPVKEMLEM